MGEAGRLTQRLEYLVYTEGVRGSNPLSPNDLRQIIGFGY